MNVAAAEMVVFKGVFVEIVDVEISSTLPTVLFIAIAVILVTSVVSVVAVTVVMVDRDVARVIGISFGANVVVVVPNVIGIRFVGNNVLAVVAAVCSVDTTALMVAIVVFIGVSVAANGNWGQFGGICGPSILSNT